MADIKAALERKFGPLPAWAWAGIGGGGLWWYRQHTAGSTSTADQQTGAVQSPAFVGPWGADPASINGGAVPSGDGGGASGTTTSAPTDTAGPPVINIAAPPASAPSARPRHHKPKPQHTKNPPKRGKTKTKRSDAHTHQTPARQRAAHNRQVSRTVASDRRQMKAAKTHAAKGRKVGKR